MKQLEGRDGLNEAVGTIVGPSDWLEIDQRRLDDWRDAIGDPSPYLALSLTNWFLPRLIEVTGFDAGVNYGADGVRFGERIVAGDRLRATAEPTSVTEVSGGVQVAIRITVEVDGQATPAVVVESLSRFLDGPSDRA